MEKQKKSLFGPMAVSYTHLDATAILHAGRNQWFLGTPREYLASPYGKRFGGDLS